MTGLIISAAAIADCVMVVSYDLSHVISVGVGLGELQAIINSNVCLLTMAVGSGQNIYKSCTNTVS